MSKHPPKMRWTNADEELLKRTINNFNAKIYRIRRKNPQHENFPDYVENYLPKPLLSADVESLRGTIYSRNDFKKIINRYQRFSKKGAEDPIKTKRSGKMTKWMQTEINIGNRTRNQIRANKKEELGEKPLTSRGEPVGGKRKEQGDVWQEYLNPVEFDIQNKSNAEIERTLKAIDSEIFDSNRLLSAQSYKDNYLSTMDDFGYPEQLISLVESIPVDVFYETTVTDTDATIEFLYYETYQEFQYKTQALYRLWSVAKSKIQTPTNNN